MLWYRHNNSRSSSKTTCSVEIIGFTRLKKYKKLLSNSFPIHSNAAISANNVAQWHSITLSIQNMSTTNCFLYFNPDRAGFASLMVFLITSICSILHKFSNNNKSKFLRIRNIILSSDKSLGRLSYVNLNNLLFLYLPDWPSSYFCSFFNSGVRYLNRAQSIKESSYLRITGKVHVMHKL